MNWIVCQIGAREHYAVPRALFQQEALGALITDLWVPPGHAFGKLPGARRLQDRFHPDLAKANVIAPNVSMLGLELKQRIMKCRGWPAILERNVIFQKSAIASLSAVTTDRDSSVTLFSYSYAALELFRFAKSRGWRTVLGQIDPGPEEERLVAAEHERYSNLTSSWQKVPSAYWKLWKEEIDLADRIIVNSEWSRQCLLKEGVQEDLLEVVPLVYEDQGARNTGCIHATDPSQTSPLRVLFLGQVNLRKGVGRLLDAMRLLKEEPIELTLAGPTEIDPSAWADLPDVKWVGPVPRSDVGRYYDQADLFILPTLSDGYALTQLEALSRGLPVMASRHCGEAVEPGKNGWILDDLEPQTIAAQLSAIARAFPEFRNCQSPDVGRVRNFGLKKLATALLRECPANPFS